MTKPVKLLLPTLFLTAFLFVQAFAVNPNPIGDTNPQAISTELTEEFATNTLDDFLALTPKAYKEKTGKRMKLKQIIALKVAQKKVRKNLDTLSEGSEGDSKSQLVALLLGIFVGGLGIHRFYLGYTGIGVVQILTLGGCGIWALIDVIRIALGDLVPKDGSAYDPEL